MEFLIINSQFLIKKTPLDFIGIILNLQGYII